LQTESYTLLKAVGKRFLDMCLEPRWVQCGNAGPYGIRYAATWKYLFADNDNYQWMMRTFFTNDIPPPRRNVLLFPRKGYCIVVENEGKSHYELFEETWALHNQTYRTLVLTPSGNAYRRTSGILADIDRALMVGNDFAYAAELIELEAYMTEYERILTIGSNFASIFEARAKLFGKEKAREFRRDIEKLKLIMGALEDTTEKGNLLRADEQDTPLDFRMHHLLLETEEQRMRLLLQTNPTLYRAVRRVQDMDHGMEHHTTGGSARD